jgi:competence protein ComGC
VPWILVAVAVVAMLLLLVPRRNNHNINRTGRDGKVARVVQKAISHFWLALDLSAHNLFNDSFDPKW